MSVPTQMLAEMNFVHHELANEFILRRTRMEPRAKLLYELYPSLSLSGMLIKVADTYDVMFNFDSRSIKWKRNGDSPLNANSIGMVGEPTTSEYVDMIVDIIHSIILNNGMPE